jgi:hypothetical protein
MTYAIHHNISRIILTAFIAFLFSYAGHASAARLYFDVANPVFGPNQDVILPLKLDPEGESINALEVHLQLPTTHLSYKNFYDGKSFISTWVDMPKEENGVLSFSGIVPGGFDGIIDPFSSQTKQPGIVGYITFSTKNVGTASITSTPDTALFLNDGVGTPTSISFSPFSFIIKQGAVFTSSLPKDATSPLPFTIELSSDPDSFNGKYFIVFNTQDKESGIDHYEIKEGADDFVVASSPYVLVYQNLGVPIVVKAFDKNGNTRLVSIHPDGLTEKSHPLQTVFIGLCVLLVILLVFRKRLNGYGTKN